MALIEHGLFDTTDKVAIAIARFQQFVKQALALHPEGFYLAFSGGKDSQCIYHLAELAGVPFRAYMHLTTVDAPELLRFVRDHYPKVVRERPKDSMWRMIVKERIPPTRLFRYCCETLKEGGGSGRLVVTGVRNAESNARAGRRMVEVCMKDPTKTFLHPIIDWTNADVWEFLNSRNIPHCSLYDEGFTRIGCIGCPMGSRSGRLKQFERWPRFEALYKRAMQACLDKRRKDGLPTPYPTLEEYWDWWMEKNPKRTGNEGQQSMMFDQLGGEE